MTLSIFRNFLENWTTDLRYCGRVGGDRPKRWPMMIGETISSSCICGTFATLSPHMWNTCYVYVRYLCFHLSSRESSFPSTCLVSFFISGVAIAGTINRATINRSIRAECFSITRSLERTRGSYTDLRDLPFARLLLMPHGKVSRLAQIENYANVEFPSAGAFPCAGNVFRPDRMHVPWMRVSRESRYGPTRCVWPHSLHGYWISICDIAV